jgi:hypothetical protein
MRNAKARVCASAAILCFVHSPVGVATAQDDDVDITNERLPTKTERVVNGDEICSEQHGLYRLMVTSKRSPSDFYFQLDNRGTAPVFVDLMREGETYETDYPNAQLFFRTEERDVWKAALVSPGEFDSTGVERVSIEPGMSIVFAAPVLRYVPRGSKIVKLQLQIHTSPDNTGSEVCVSSAPFRT